MSALRIGVAASVLVIVGCAVGCASLSALGSGEDSPVAYGADAEANLKLGETALDDKNYIEAIKYFEFVKTKYPYLEAAKTAELKLADADFERDQFAEARDRYQNFVRLHPTHSKVDYADYRAALTHFKDIPSDFFLLPPPWEKDQVEVRSAMTSMEAFLRSRPESEYAKDAKEVLSSVRARLAEHELYVADFYRRRDRWPAVVGRLKAAAKNYSGSDSDDRVYFGLHEAHLKLNDPAQAEEALRSFLLLHPSGPQAQRARDLLGRAVLAVPDAG